MGEPLPFTRRQLEEALATAVVALKDVASRTGKQEDRWRVAESAAFKMTQQLNMSGVGWQPFAALLHRLIDSR